MIYKLYKKYTYHLIPSQSGSMDSVTPKLHQKSVNRVDGNSFVKIFAYWRTAGM